MNGSVLAYIGDVYYELLVRTYLVKKGITKVDVLHKSAIKYTSGEAQSFYVNEFIKDKILTEEEIEVFKKGRNCASSYRKNISMADYQKATGLEAIIGKLYVDKKYERIEALMDKIFEWGKNFEKK